MLRQNEDTSSYFVRMQIQGVRYDRQRVRYQMVGKDREGQDKALKAMAISLYSTLLMPTETACSARSLKPPLVTAALAGGERAPLSSARAARGGEGDQSLAVC